MCYTVERGWVDAAGCCRTWKLFSPDGKVCAEVTTKTAAYKLAELLSNTEPQYDGDTKMIAWNDIVRKYYSSDQEAETLAWARANGMTEFVVAYGGVRLIVRHIGETLIEICPKAVSRNPWQTVNIVLCPPEATTGKIVPMRGENYDVSYGGGTKLREALYEIFVVWAAAPDRDSVYKIVSGKTFHCAMCGADLTDELSTSRGIGPECWKKIGRAEVKTEVRRKRNTV